MSATDSQVALYISYNSVEEPLVQSQVVNYLRELNCHGWRFLLLTFEREPISERHQNALRDALAGSGINWQPVFYRPGALGTAQAIIRARRLGIDTIREHDARLIHCRSFIPALVGFAAAKTTGLPWIYDIRGFWMEEKVYKGRISARSPVYHLGKWLEQALYQRCQGIVTLTRASATIIRHLPLWQRRPVPPLKVIPTCVDIDAFANQRSTASAPRFAYLGSMGRGYMSAEVLDFARTVAAAPLNASCDLITRTAPRSVAGLNEALAKFPSSLSITSANPAAIPKLLANLDIGLSFIEPHYSKQAACPTKLGEYLAAGMAVIANDIGDVGDLLRRHRVGVIIDDFSPAGYRAAAQQAIALREEVDFAERCQRAASEFSLESGSLSYLQLYQQILAGPDKALA